jgi:transposase
MSKLSTSKNKSTPIPTQLNEQDFNGFILPHLSMPKRGPKCQIGYHKVFNYILKVLYTGRQWEERPIELDLETGKREIHYTNVYKHFAKWQTDGSWERVFNSSVFFLNTQEQLDVSIIHGDGSNTIAKKGGDGIGYSGHQHQKGEKTMAIVENNGYILSPMTVDSVNRHDTSLLPESLNHLSKLKKNIGLALKGTVFHRDSGFDSLANRK